MNLGFSASAFLTALDLPADICLEPSLVKLALSRRVVLTENVHQVGDVAGRQSERFDLGQLRVGRNVRNAAPQRRKRRVDAVRTPPLLLIGTDPPFHHFSTSWNDLDHVGATGRRKHGREGHVFRSSCAQIVVMRSHVSGRGLRRRRGRGSERWRGPCGLWMVERSVVNPRARWSSTERRLGIVECRH